MCNNFGLAGDCRWLYSQNKIKERDAQEQMNLDLANTVPLNNKIVIDYSKLLSWSILANKPDTGMYEFFTKPISPMQIEIRYKGSFKIPDTDRVYRSDKNIALPKLGLSEEFYSFD